MKKSSCSKLLLACLPAGLAGLLLLPAAPAAAQDDEEPEVRITETFREDAEPAEGPAAPPTAGSSTGGAAAEEVPPTLLGMEERVSLDLRSTEVTDALKYLATKGGLNIAISKNVSGRVNLFLTDVPIRDVFDLVLRSNELAYDKQGDVYNIMTEAEYRSLYGKRFSDVRSVKTFRLQYAVPQQAFNLLDTLKSEIGRLLVDEESGTVLVLDTPEKLAEMEAALATMESGGTIRVFDLKYAKAKDIEERLNEQLEANRLGYVKADERSNQVIVKTLPNRLKEVETLIAALDRKTREVLIDARIVKVTLTDGRDTGIDWNNVFANLTFHGIDTVGDFRNSVTGTPPAEVPSVTKIKLPIINLPYKSALGNTNPEFHLGALAFGTVARDGYELFRFLQTIGRTKLISNPRLMVTENQEAKILVGTREAFVTSTSTTSTSGTTTAEEVEFVDVGIQLVVTPTNINEDGFVTMKIKPEVSSVVRTLKTKNESVVPIVDTSTAETTVMVKDGSTVIIGGLRKNQKQSSDDHIPFFGKIPIFGELFTQRDQSDELAELVVFITPHITGGETLLTGQEPPGGREFKPYHGYDPLLLGRPQARAEE